MGNMSHLEQGRWDVAAFQQIVAAEPPSLAIIRRELDRVLGEQPFPPSRRADVRLAVSEACANAVMHAYPEDEPGEILISAGISADTLVVTVRDYGCGLPARRPPTGIGVTLIHALADAVDAVDADPGVAVRMEFRL
jgi:anti-sigma regulatory factor (Ser/Thr protein kinase)